MTGASPRRGNFRPLMQARAPAAFTIARMRLGDAPSISRRFTGTSSLGGASPCGCPGLEGPSLPLQFTRLGASPVTTIPERVAHRRIVVTGLAPVMLSYSCITFILATVVL